MVGKLHHWFDRTAGCIAVTNKEMDELYQNVRIGTPIEINP
jgi:lipoprotein-anchoring transpeptidase ErfK/SrfK